MPLASWLTALPLEEHGFTLHKSAFRDALALRYGWAPLHIPSHCVCGCPFSVHHALSCPRGGFPAIRHNELRDLTASLLKETCHGVATEPSLQPISSETFDAATVNTQDGARLDIVANGFWGGAFERAFFDVRVFNPFAPSNRQSSLAAAYRLHERLKKRHYERRIREVEHSSFTPLVFFPHWWSCACCHCFLQTPGFTTRRQMEATLQLRNWLAALQNFVLFAQSLDNVPQRC